MCVSSKRYVEKYLGFWGRARVLNSVVRGSFVYKWESKVIKRRVYWLGRLFSGREIVLGVGGSSCVVFK